MIYNVMQSTAKYCTRKQQLRQMDVFQKYTHKGMAKGKFLQKDKNETNTLIKIEM